MSASAPAARLTTEAFFETLFSGCDGGMVELRALPSTTTQFSAITNHAVRRGFIARCVPTEDLYVGVATRKDASSGKLVNCAALPALATDIDFKKTPEAAARAALAAFPLPPTLVVHSGGGLHVYWGLREPFSLTDAEASATATAWLRRLACALGGDLSAAEPARVLRVPNTFNRKPDYGTPRPVVLELCAPDRRYNVSEVMEWCPEIEAGAPGSPFQMPVEKVGQGKRNALLFRLARSLKAKGLTPAAILAAALAENQTKCDPPHSEAEVRRAVESALAQPDRPWAGASTNGRARVIDADAEAEPDDPEADAGPSPDLPTALPFPDAAWRGPLATWKAATDGTTEAPDAIRYAAAIVPLSLRLGRRVSIYYGARLYANQYVVGFGPTGATRKTSAGRAARLMLPASVRVVRGVGSGEALIEALQSSEATGGVDALLEADELAVLLARAKWDASSLPAILTEAYDSPETLEVRLRKGNLLARAPFVSVLGFTTAEWFWRSMPEVHVTGGLGNRFLYLTGTPGPPLAFPPRPDPEAVAAFLAALGACDAHVAACPADALYLSRTDLSPTVRALWEEFYGEWTGTERGLPDLLAAAVRRLPAYAWKLTLLYGYLERTLPTLTVAQLAAALEVVHYALASARILVEARGASTEQGRLESRIRRVLATRDLPAWQLHQAVGSDCALEDVLRALRALAAARVVCIVSRTRRGTDVWGLTRRVRPATGAKREET